jgi:hypothetical protein
MKLYIIALGKDFKRSTRKHGKPLNGSSVPDNPKPSAFFIGGLA